MGALVEDPGWVPSTHMVTYSLCNSDSMGCSSDLCIVHMWHIQMQAKTLIHIKSKINKWDLIKLKCFYKAKDTVNRTKWKPTDWEKIITNPIFDRGLMSNIYKVLKKLNSK